MKKIITIGLMISVFIFSPAAPSLLASDDQIPYGIRMPYRIVRGITNVGLGWTEILLRPFGEHGTESVLEAMSMGGANTLVRLGVGLTDITTFWVPDMQMLDLYPDWQGWPYLFHWS